MTRALGIELHGSIENGLRGKREIQGVEIHVEVHDVARIRREARSIAELRVLEWLTPASGDFLLKIVGEGATSGAAIADLERKVKRLPELAKLLDTLAGASC